MKNTSPTALIKSFFSADSLLNKATEAEKAAVRKKQNEALWTKLYLAALVYLSVNVFFHHQ